ncbi:redoxin domain-containing protein [Bacillus selenatarsenatis]|uniref:Redoxin domain-containing protein n=1 Tax=Mesobacillus selenatarsenatis TaxID=388741 RepID=A0A846TW03_9BACI|nr:redoxin domain-containing protein [Mesobacillus selenatarsenatis]
MANRGLNVGKPAPDFALPGTYNTKYSLSDFAGQPIIIVFLRGTW